MVLHHVWRVHLRGRSRELDVTTRPGHHSFATGWIFEGYHHARALPHHGKMDAGLLHFLGLHRVRSVHAYLVCEHTGGDAIFYYSKHGVVVGVEHAAGGRALLYLFWDSSLTLDQKGAAAPLLGRWMDP